MAKILVLSSHDSHMRGHGWYSAELLKKEGHETCFIALFKRCSDTPNFFYDTTKRFSLAAIWQKLLPYITCMFTGNALIYMHSHQLIYLAYLQNKF